MTSDLGERSRRFADEVADLLARTVGCPAPVLAVGLRDGQQYVVRPGDTRGRPVRVPLHVDGEHLADLEVAMYQVLDRVGCYVKTHRADFRVFSTLERTPLLRLEYDAAARTVPAAHWQFHAERGAFVHLLTIAGRTRHVRGPADLSKLHLPVGGERFRPGLEDVVELLIRDCGIDGAAGWESAVGEGRRRWRVRQLRSVVRDQQEEAAGLLGEMGWTVSRPGPAREPHDAPYTRW